jgi:hypothetical protein
MPDPVDSDAILAALQEAASGPESASSDAGSVKQYSLADLLAAHKYLAAVAASQQANKTSGLRFGQILPGGSVQRGWWYPRGAPSGGGWDPWQR